jgi:hypothetical protein
MTWLHVLQWTAAGALFTLIVFLICRELARHERGPVRDEELDRVEERENDR